jgi:hypothetical protein
MTPVAQTKYGRHQGNCLTACVATVLDVPISSLPEFCVDGEWFSRLDSFCRENGFFLLYWRHAENTPILCFNAYIILLLSLQGEDDLHAVVAKTSLESKHPVTDEDIEQGAALAEDAGGFMWGWRSEIVHDPNERGYPPVEEIRGYIMIGKQ